MSGQTLGDFLRQARKLQGFTTRQVEEATGVSNSYLSQLENNKITKPSATVLYKLSKIYAVSIEACLKAAGIIPDFGENANHIFLPPFKEFVLSNEEEESLLKYLEFLRWQKRKP